MNEIIRNLRILNYKSIKRLEFNCSRINVFVGEPNVGKSNILEAINLNYLSWFFNSDDMANAKAMVKRIYRADDMKSLFRGYNDNGQIIVSGWTSKPFRVDIQKNLNNNYNWIAHPGSEMEITNDFEPQSYSRFAGGGVRPYYYRSDVKFDNEGNYSALKPPYGANLIHVLESDSSLRSQFDNIFSKFGYKILLDRKDEKLSIIRDEQNGFVFSVPFHAISDTLKRLMFYVTAIRSNHGYYLVFEEPEVHSFPPYISLLGDEIIKSDNQFFIVTHSPYLLNNLVENTPENELKVFVCGYDKKEYQTIVKELSSKDLSELLDYGVDIFFNLNRYLDDRVEHSS